MSTIPKEVKALTFTNSKDVSVKTITFPSLRPSYLFIKLDTIALNPTDWKCVTHLPGAKPFSIVGCDYSGTVVQIGSEVTKSFSIGDKIFGCAHGSNQSEAYDGAFAEYAMVKGDVAMHAPSNTNMEDLPTIPLCAITAGQGLFQPGKGLGLPWSEDGKGSGDWILINGGATTAGCLGIQFAKLAGFKVITTCSPRNNELVKSRGADEVFDYNDPEHGAKINKLTENKLRYVWDTVCEAKGCNEALSSDTSICHYATVLFSDEAFPRKDMKVTVSLMYTMFGEAFEKYGQKFPASEEDFEFAKSWMGITEKLVKEGKLKPHPKRLESGGLEGIVNGLDQLKAEKVRGEKLVYKI